MAFWILGRRVKTCSKENRTIAGRQDISMALASANGLTAFHRGEAGAEN